MITLSVRLLSIVFFLIGSSFSSALAINFDPWQEEEWEGTWAEYVAYQAALKEGDLPVAFGTHSPSFQSSEEEA